MRRPLLIVLMWLALLEAAGAADNLVMIAHPASGVEKLSREEAVNIFMGRYKKLPSGITALPVDESGEKAAFYRALVGKELPDIHSYWARLVFSGQGSPPRQLEGASEVLEIVSNNRGAIGYIDRKNVNNRVKVVLDLSH